MGFFSKDKKKDKYVQLYEEHYLKALDSLSGLKIVNNLEKELVPVMIVICDFACVTAGKNKNEIMDKIMEYAVGKYIMNQVEYDVLIDRISLYIEFLNGKDLRAEWLYGNIEGIIRNPVLNCCIGFGDILVNPSCADDYEHAPILINDFFEVANFSMLFNSKFFPMMVEFHNKIYRA